MREMYPHAPVVLVAIEARHPFAPVLTEGEQSEIKRLVGKDFPLLQPVQNVMLTPTRGSETQLQSLTFPRFTTRDQSTAVTFGTEAVAVETTRHKGFDHLLSLLSKVIAARQQVHAVDGLLRLGLRYVDEIRVPEVCDVSDWGDWIAPELSGSSKLSDGAGLAVNAYQGIINFGRGENKQLNLRYGPMNGYAVQPGGLLQRPTPPPGPFFLLDTDSYWVPDGEVPEFEAKIVSDLARDLHAPVSRLFENLITDRLREEVLRDA